VQAAALGRVCKPLGFALMQLQDAALLFLGTVDLGTYQPKTWRKLTVGQASFEAMNHTT
jgi:hypothetical protein